MMIFRTSCVAWLIKRGAIGVFAAFLAAAGQSAAQKYPSKPVRLVVPSSPGGAGDLVARIVAPLLSETLGQPFIVENRTTGGGTIGTLQVARAPADGHTLLVTFDTFTINPFLFKDLQWDPIKDFSPVMLVCSYPQMLLVNPSLGVRTVKDFVALAKRKGAELNYGTAGPASVSRLVYELFKEVAGIETVVVNYKGGGPAVQDLIAGQVHTMFMAPNASILQNIRAGKLVALALTSPKQSSVYPDLPAIAETYPGFETEGWVGLFAPAGTPKNVIVELQGSLAGILSRPGMKERFQQQGADIVASSPEELARRMKEGQAKWGKLIHDKKISLE